MVNSGNVAFNLSCFPPHQSGLKDIHSFVHHKHSFCQLQTRDTTFTNQYDYHIKLLVLISLKIWNIAVCCFLKKSVKWSTIKDRPQYYLIYEELQTHGDIRAVEQEPQGVQLIRYCFSFHGKLGIKTEMDLVILFVLYLLFCSLSVKSQGITSHLEKKKTILFS